MENYVIKKATQSDIEAIVAICAENLLQNKSEDTKPKDISARGFLMGQLNEEVVKKMIDDNENYLVFVAKNNDEVVGYIIAQDISIVDEPLRGNILSESKAQNSKILYYRQIAKKAGSGRVGSVLLKAMIAEAKARNYKEISCIIVHEPFYNKASIEFHEKNGLKFIKIIDEIKRKVGLYSISLISN